MENTLINILIHLGKKGVSTSIKYSEEKGCAYLDLETKAKSHLHLYPNGQITGRYDYIGRINLESPINNIIKVLCNEFNEALHYRSFGQTGWFELCKELGVKVECPM